MSRMEEGRRERERERGGERSEGRRGENMRREG